MRVVLLISLVCFGCYSPQQDCKKFATGTFTSEVLINGVNNTSTFTRTKTLQIETYNGKTDSAAIRWINSCEMVYKTINPKSRAQQKAIHVKILTTTDSSYTYEYSYVGEQRKQKGIAVLHLE